MELKEMERKLNELFYNIDSITYLNNQREKEVFKLALIEVKKIINPNR